MIKGENNMKEKINNFMNDTIIPNILKFVNLKGIVALRMEYYLHYHY